MLSVDEMGEKFESPNCKFTVTPTANQTITARRIKQHGGTNFMRSKAKKGRTILRRKKFITLQKMFSFAVSDVERLFGLRLRQLSSTSRILV